MTDEQFILLIANLCLIAGYWDEKRALKRVGYLTALLLLLTIMGRVICKTFQ